MRIHKDKLLINALLAEAQQPSEPVDLLENNHLLVEVWNRNKDDYLKQA